ncbi:PLD nuclease N-terminal domain-containing protein [Aerococcus urinae]
MNNVSEYLPFLIPVIVLQVALLVYTLHHILTHKTYKRGGRTFWLVVVIVFMQFVGPILYLLFGKEED